MESVGSDYISSDASDSDLDDDVLQAIDSEHDVDSESDPNNGSRHGSHGGSHKPGSQRSGQDESDSDDEGNSDGVLRSPGDSECADDEYARRSDLAASESGSSLKSRS